MFQDKLKWCIKEIGLKPKHSSHSLRRGSVAWARRSGVPHHFIKLFGDWSSDAFVRYLEYPIEMRAAVSMKMAHFLTVAARK